MTTKTAPLSQYLHSTQSKSGSNTTLYTPSPGINDAHAKTPPGGLLNSPLHTLSKTAPTSVNPKPADLFASIQNLPWLPHLTHYLSASSYLEYFDMLHHRRSSNMIKVPNLLVEVHLRRKYTVTLTRNGVCFYRGKLAQRLVLRHLTYHGRQDHLLLAWEV